MGIAGLFWLERERKTCTSAGLWIPVVWLLISGSRPVSAWLHLTPPTDHPDAYLEGSPIDRIVLTVLLALGLIALIKRGQQVARVLRANGPILLFFTYCAVSTTWSDYPEVAFKRWIKALGDLVMVTIVVSDVDPSAAVRRLLTRVSFLLLPLSVLLVKYYPDLGRGYTYFTWTPFYTGVSTDKNGLGLLCLVCGLGGLWQFLDVLQTRDMPHRRRRLMAQGAVLAMVLWLLSIANSVTSISCFVSGGIFIVMTRLFAWSRKPAVIHATVFGVMLLSIFAVFIAPASGLLESLGRNPTLTGRTDIWAHVIPLNSNPLLGTGYESFWLGDRLAKMWSIYWWHPNEAHNGYLEIFLNLGWIGVALLCLLLATGYRNIFAAYRCDPETGRVRLAYFVAAVLYSFSEAGFRELTPIWLFFLLAVIAIPTSSITEPMPDFWPEFNEDRANELVSVGPAFGLELRRKNIDWEITCSLLMPAVLSGLLRAVCAYSPFEVPQSPCLVRVWRS